MTLHDLLLALLPRGAYSREPEALHVLELQAQAEVLQEVDASVDAMLPELFGDSALTTLDRWEGMLGLIRGSGDTTEQRLAVVVSALQRRPSLAPSYIAEVIGLLTLSACTVTEFLPLFYGEGEYGDLYVEGKVFQFLVVVDYDEAVAADAHWERVQPVVDALKPAHTQGFICYNNALYDDPPWSPYDHCCYGV